LYSLSEAKSTSEHISVGGTREKNPHWQYFNHYATPGPSRII